jgi:hypothetical protein
MPWDCNFSTTSIKDCEMAMQKKYLGDSYDLMKRFWCKALCPIAPLYAHPRFVPNEIRIQYTSVTTIPIFETTSAKAFGLLLDPHTGIPLPSEAVEKVTASHAPLSFLVQNIRTLASKYTICFDQSFHRKHQLTKEDQRAKKREFLRERGIVSFYYVSHAPFLFAARDTKIIDAIRDRLLTLGIPRSRLE